MAFNFYANESMVWITVIVCITLFLSVLIFASTLDKSTPESEYNSCLRSNNGRSPEEIRTLCQPILNNNL